MVKEKNADTPAASTRRKKNKGKKKSKKKKINNRVKSNDAKETKGSDVNLNNHVPSTSNPFQRPDTWRDVAQVRLVNCFSGHFHVHRSLSYIRRYAFIHHVTMH